LQRPSRHWPGLRLRQGQERATGSATVGSLERQSNLGIQYENGNGVTQGHVEAVSWYRLSAKQGYANAQSNLGGMYRAGNGVKQDQLKPCAGAGWLPSKEMLSLSTASVLDTTMAKV
jgi:TPR repeat protein